MALSGCRNGEELGWSGGERRREQIDKGAQAGLLSSIEPRVSIAEEQLASALATSGLRLTRQREQIYNVVLQSGDHPTADEIHHRARQAMPDISFATVYNCLSVLVQCGLVRQVTLDRAPARFCPNMKEHSHFFCEGCGDVIDVDAPDAEALRKLGLPEGARVTHYDLALRGLCPKCVQ